MGVPTEVYRGPKTFLATGRDIRSCENTWSYEDRQITSFDKLLSNQLELAQERGETGITVIDIGCGQGNLFKDFLHTQFSDGEEATTETIQFLKNNPTIGIRLVGLTDATPDLPNTSRKLSAHTWNLPNASAKIVPFSLAKEQTYNDFLKAENISSVNLTLATFSVSYFHPFLFRDTVRQIIDSLSEDGVALITPYSYKSGKSLSRYTIPPAGVDSQNSGPLSKQSMAIERLINGTGIIATEVSSLVEKQLRLLDIFHRYVTADIASLTPLVQKGQTPLRKITAMEVQMEKLTEEIKKKSNEKILNMKQEIIEQIQTEYQHQATLISNYQNLFIIKKPNTTLNDIGK